MTSDIIWDRISKIKRDPCIPRYEQKTFVTTNNPYIPDPVWKKRREEFIAYMGSDIGREDRVYLKEDALRKMLEDCKNSTEADAKFVAAQLENHTGSAIDEVRKTWTANMSAIEHDVQDALRLYGRVSSIEMKARWNETLTMEIKVDISSRFNFDEIRYKLSKLPWIHRVIHVEFDAMCRGMKIIIELNTTAFNEERKNNMPPKRDYSGYFATADSMHKPPESIADMMAKFFTGPSIRIKRVMFNGPATIVYWSDNTKTIVKCMDDEEFDPEKGLAMAICKRLYGGDFHRVFKDTLKNAETRKGDEAKRARKLRVTRAKIKSVK